MNCRQSWFLPRPKASTRTPAPSLPWSHALQTSHSGTIMPRSGQEAGLVPALTSQGPWASKSPGSTKLGAASTAPGSSDISHSEGCNRPIFRLETGPRNVYHRPKKQCARNSRQGLNPWKPSEDDQDLHTRMLTAAAAFKRKTVNKTWCIMRGNTLCHERSDFV